MLLSLDQPSNVFSAIGFIIVAIYIVLRRPRNQLSWLYAGALLLVGVGSAYYHAKLTFLGQTIDFGGMDLVILIAPFQYLAQQKNRLAWSWYVFSVVTTLALLVWAPEVRRAIFAVLVILVLWLYGFDPKKIVSHNAKYWLWRGLAIFLFGYIFWNLDTYRVLCAQTSWIQGHAIWHIASAIAAYCLYRLIKTDSTTDPVLK